MIKYWVEYSFSIYLDCIALSRYVSAPSILPSYVWPVSHLPLQNSPPVPSDHTLHASLLPGKFWLRRSFHFGSPPLRLLIMFHSMYLPIRFLEMWSVNDHHSVTEAYVLTSCIVRLSLRSSAGIFFELIYFTWTWWNSCTCGTIT